VDAKMTLYTGFLQLGAGLSVGLAGLAAGFAIGIVGDAGVRGTAQQPRLFVGMVGVMSSLGGSPLLQKCINFVVIQILILIFAEVFFFFFSRLQADTVF
jgi:F0F1-type ATP synthase membrane subunit c/vacuolar-type H+-ATPase subunit K